MYVEFVVGSRFVPKVFLRVPWFCLLHLKTNISKFQFSQENGTAWKPARADATSFLNIVIYLFILILFMLELQWLGS